MTRVRLPRLALIVMCVLAWLGALHRTGAADRSPAATAKAATAFLASLTPEQRQEAAFPFESDERLKWHFIPAEMFPRKGLTIERMTEPQRKLVHALLQAGLSQRGYLTATSASPGRRSGCNT